MLDPWLQFAVTLTAAIVIAVIVSFIVTGIVRLIARRHDWPGDLVRRARRPFRAVVLVVAVWAGIGLAFPRELRDEWMPPLTQTLTIAVILASAWLLSALVSFATDLALGRHRIDVPDNRHARRIRTQTLIVRRLALVLIVVVAIGAILLTFPAVRTVGASLLASAGIASIVAGLAAQSVLANIFAGVQLVFSDALRVDDVVVVEGEWGRIGEITLSYVVVDLWDERRLVLPCTHFTTQPFENWTRQGSELLGAVEIDVDWRVSPARMRRHLDEILADTDLWDGRTSVLQVTDAVGGLVRVRILVSARDAPTLFDLRCRVREDMVVWVQQAMPAAVPAQRLLWADSGTDATPSDGRDAARHNGADASIGGRTDDADVLEDDHGSGLFTGSAEAERRASTFTQAIPIVHVDGAGDPRR
ncbi:mechanosensitive ion channel family protein [Microbacterium sp. HMH0099]|uniref:mechanosensitive ion channel family protein n=1 Tax=Microbacterium sp. HMH0099 TaxID=3414026 RepID=UPI003BF69201